MRSWVAPLAVVLLLLACHPEAKNGPSNSSSTTTPTESSGGLSGEEMRLRSHSGGYVRGPGKERVIVFVNGLFGDAVSTWRAPNGAYWPALLASDPLFNDTDLYVHSFDSPKVTTAQNIDELAGRMRDYLQRDRVFENHRQVVFLVHSMGGLVTRAYLLKLRPSPDKVPMIYFFATPTTGANVAQIANVVSDNPQLQSMLPLREEGYVGDLQNAWLVTSEDPNLNYPARIASFCAYEKKDTFGVRIVERQSATNLCNRETRGIAANHLEIVKPDDPGTSDAYVFFKVAYDRTVGAGSVPIARALMEGTAPTERNFVSTASIASAASVSREPLLLKQSRLDTRSIRVGCGETKEGEITATLDLAPGEEIIGVRPVVENARNVFKSSVALVRYEGNTALIRYSLSGVQGSTARIPAAGLRHDFDRARATTEVSSAARITAGAAAAERGASVAAERAAVAPGIAERTGRSIISRTPEVAVDVRQIRVLRPIVEVPNCPGDGSADVVVSFILRGARAGASEP